MSDLANLPAYLAFAAAAFATAYLLLVRVRDRRIVAGVVIAMLALKFAAIVYLDLEPFGEPSIIRDGGALLPAWLVGLATANQFGVWGALAALLARHRRDRDAGAVQPRQ